MKIHPDHVLHLGSLSAGMSLLSNPSWYWTCECGKGRISTDIDSPPDNQYVCSECESFFSIKNEPPYMHIIDIGHSYKGLIDISSISETK